MSTTGTYAFDPNVAAVVDDAFERCGKDPAFLTARHLRSARRSMEFILKSWPNMGCNQWAIDLQTHTFIEGAQTFTMPNGSIEILSAVLRRDGYDTPMEQVSRTEYLDLNKKDQEGVPDRYMVARVAPVPTVYVWPTCDNSTDQMVYWRIRTLQDVGTPQNTLDLPNRFLEAFTAALAAKLAEKYAPEREDKLILKATAALHFARTEDREQADLQLDIGCG